MANFVDVPCCVFGSLGRISASESFWSKCLVMYNFSRYYQFSFYSNHIILQLLQQYPIYLVSPTASPEIVLTNMSVLTICCLQVLFQLNCPCPNPFSWFFPLLVSLVLAWGRHICRQAVNTNCLSPLLSNNTFWDGFSYWTRNLLSSGSPGCSCLRLPRAQIIGTYYHVWLLHQCWGITLRSICLRSKHFTDWIISL